MEETSEELPNFSIGIDLLGPDPTSSKNTESRKALASCTFRKFVGLLSFKTYYSDTWPHLALIFFIFPVNLSFSFTVIDYLDQMRSLKPKY